MRLTRSIAALVASGSIAIVISPARAQMVRGTLVDAITEQPLNGAEISLFHQRGIAVARSVTDTGGRYVLLAPRSGTFYLSVRHLGYKPATSTQFELDSATLTVGIRLELVSERLGTIRIVAEGIPPIDLSDGFAERRAKGIGYFRTRDEIKRAVPQLATDAFRGFPGLEVATSMDQLTGTRQYTLSSTRGLRTVESVCGPGVYIDGIQALAELNDVLRADELDKIEFYPTSHGMPAGYRAGGCGTIIIWTNRYHDK